MTSKSNPTDTKKKKKITFKMAKQYGLILPNKNKPKLDSMVARPSIFGDDSDSDNSESKPTGITKRVKKQDKINQNKAVEEDPTVYQYDEIYDEMDKKRKESKLARKDLDKKPKYISKLLAAAERRKRENERRIERQVQKEREEEGDLYRDKESFVTSAYKKKLEEMRKLDEQEKYEEYLESIGDVKKQGNLDGFYRHLYDQKVNYEDNNQPNETVEVKEPLDDKSENESLRKQTSENQSEEESQFASKKSTKERKYRKRKHSDDSDSGKEIDNKPADKKEHLPSNLDADSDFSIDSSDSEDEDKEEKQLKQSGKESNEKQLVDKQNDEVIKPKENDKVKTEAPEEVETNGVEKVEVKVEELEIEEEEVKIKKPKVDIWKKRTVGEKFDEAVKRYFERKAQREMVISS